MKATLFETLIELGRQKKYVTLDNILHFFPEAEKDIEQNEVYMPENKDNLRAGTVKGLFFSEGECRASGIYYFDTTAIFAKASVVSPGLSSLKNAMG